MEVLDRDFDGFFDPDGSAAKTPLRIHVRSSVAGGCSVRAESLATVKPDDLKIGQTGRLANGGGEGSVAVEHATLVSVVRANSGHAELVIDIADLRYVDTKAEANLASFSPLPPGAAAVIRWYLTGATYIAENLASAGVVLSEQSPAVSLRLCQVESRTVSRASGHVVQNITLVPCIEARVDMGGHALDAIDAVMSEWQRRVELMCTCMAYWSAASVEWRARSVEVHGPKGGSPQLLRSEWHFGPVIVSGRTASGPPLTAGALLSAEVNLASWGTHARRAVDLYVASHALSHDAQFVALSTALEAVKQAFLDSRANTKLLSGGAVNKLRKALKTQLGEMKIAEDIVCDVLEKVGELARPSYLKTVRLMCADLTIVIGDIYPDELTFVDVRNKLIHQGEVPERRRFDDEIARLRELVRRAIGVLLASRNPKVSISSTEAVTHETPSESATTAPPPSAAPATTATGDPNDANTPAREA